MVQSPKQELTQFMAPLPKWLQKTLWCVALNDLESFSWSDSYRPFTADELEVLKNTAGGWQPERYPRTAEELRPNFEAILWRCGRATWKEYYDNAKTSTDPHLRKPSPRRGRPRLDEKAHKAIALRDSGMTNGKIGVTLGSSSDSIRKLISSRRDKQSIQ